MKISALINASSLSHITTPSLFDTPRLSRELSSLRTTTDRFLGPDLVAAESHLHLGGGLPAEIAARLAYPRSQDLQTAYASESEFTQFLKQPPQKRSLASYLDDRYHPVSDPIFADKELLEDVAYYTALYSFMSGARKLVLRTSIKYGLAGDSKRNFSGQTDFRAEDEFGAYMRGFQRAEAETNGLLQTSLIICLRRQDPHQAKRTLQHILELRRLFGEERIVGIDIMGKEHGYKAKPFSEVYEMAHDAGLHLTAHVGEDSQVGAGAILHGINHLMAHSLGHATSMPKDPRQIYIRPDNRKVHALIDAIRSKNLRYIEMCLSSNIYCEAAYVHEIYPELIDDSGRPVQDLRSMDAHGIFYPDDALMAFGALTLAGVDPKVVLSATDGIFTLDTTLAREISLLAKNRDLGVDAILGRNLYSILYTPGPWENVADQWLTSARQYVEIPEGFLPTRDNYLKLAESLVAQSRIEAQERIHEQLGIDWSLEQMQEFVRGEVRDSRYL